MAAIQLSFEFFLSWTIYCSSNLKRQQSASSSRWRVCRRPRGRALERKLTRGIRAFLELSQCGISAIWWRKRRDSLSDRICCLVDCLLMKEEEESRNYGSRHVQQISATCKQPIRHTHIDSRAIAPCVESVIVALLVQWHDQCVTFSKVSGCFEKWKWRYERQWQEAVPGGEKLFVY